MHGPIDELSVLSLLCWAGQMPAVAVDGCSRHLGIQWMTSSTSPLLHSLHTLFSLFTPCHLPVSIWNAAVPPLSFNITLLSLFDFTTAQEDSSPYSTILLIINNFGFYSKSLFRSSFTLCHATLSSIPFKSAICFTCSAPTSCQPNSLQQLTIFFNQLPLPCCENSREERIHPCLRPHNTPKGLLRSTLTFTSQLTSKLTAFKKSKTLLLIPISFRLPHSFPWLTIVGLI